MNNMSDSIVRGSLKMIEGVMEIQIPLNMVIQSIILYHCESDDDLQTPDKNNTKADMK